MGSLPISHATPQLAAPTPDTSNNNEQRQRVSYAAEMRSAIGGCIAGFCLLCVSPDMGWKAMEKINCCRPLSKILCWSRRRGRNRGFGIGI